MMFRAIAVLFLMVVMALMFAHADDKQPTKRDELVQRLLEQAKRSNHAWMSGDSGPAAQGMVHDARFSIFGPFGGLPPPGWSDEFASRQASAAKAFQGSVSSSIELVRSYVTPEMAVLVLIERSEVRFAGHDRPQPWVLRSTVVYQPDGEGGWKVVHRHADPLTTLRSLDETLKLQAR
jgi:hypothetical protein